MLMRGYEKFDISEFEVTDRYNIPIIKPLQEYDVDKWIEFGYVNSADKQNRELYRYGVHFFEHDYRFERVWNQPLRYTKQLVKFGCLISPDFSIYTDFPKAGQIYNHYRKHWLSAYWQNWGIDVIPDISWSNKESFDWCFEGEPEGSIVSVSAIGCIKDPEARKLFIEGWNEMLTRLQPSQILLFSPKMLDELKGPIKFIHWGGLKGGQLDG